MERKWPKEEALYAAVTGHYVGISAASYLPTHLYKYTEGRKNRIPAEILVLIKLSHPPSALPLFY